jgi:hypothetical protein
VFVPHVPGDVDQAIDDGDPGKEEMVVSPPLAVAHRPGLIPGNSPVREPEHGWMASKSHFPPVQLREIEKNMYAAYHEIAEGDHIDPMADSHVAVVPIHAVRRLHLGAGPRSFARI